MVKKQLFTLFIFGFLGMLNLTHAQERLIAIKGATTDAIATTLDEAIELAQPNDKIYLPGGGFSFSGNLDKPVHIIGTGYNHLIPRSTSVSTISGDFNIIAGAEGSKFEGIKFTTIYNLADDLEFMRCYVNDSFTVPNGTDIEDRPSNISIINCMIRKLWYHDSVDIHNSILAICSGFSNSFIKNSIIERISSGGNSYLVNNTIENSVANTWNNFSSIEVINSLITSDFDIFYDWFVDVLGTNTYRILFLQNDLHLTASVTLSGVGIYHGAYAWKDGGQPIYPHIEENNSFLDVQNEEFKLKVKVVPQTH